jgi:hypothetical protein
MEIERVVKEGAKRSSFVPEGEEEGVRSSDAQNSFVDGPLQGNEVTRRLKMSSAKRLDVAKDGRDRR